MTKKGHHSLF